MPISSARPKTGSATSSLTAMQMFARYGVREYWIVDPAAESIEVYELTGDADALRRRASGADVVAPAILPGLTFPAQSLFPAR